MTAMTRWFPVHLHCVPTALASVDWMGAVVVIERNPDLVSRYWGWTGEWPSEGWARLAAFIEHWPRLAAGSPLADVRDVTFAIEDDEDLGPLARLEELARSGLSMVQLYHGGSIRYFDPWRGPTSEGRELLCELARLRIHVDLSHLHGRALTSVLADVSGPRILSHVVADSLLDWSPSVRSNALEDAQLSDANADLYGIPFVDDLVSPKGVRKRTERVVSVVDIARQIAHIVQVVGAKRVALGPDYFTSSVSGAHVVDAGTVAGMDTPAGLAALRQALAREGLDVPTIDGVFGENAARILGRKRTR